MALDKQFFEKHQRTLLWFLNTPVIRWWARYVLRIHGEGSSVGRRRITSILPHAIAWREGNDVSWEFRTHRKFAKRLYYAFYPFWWALHFWDWAVADRWVPQLSFGFNTLTVSPDADPETNTVDGQLAHTYSLGSGVSWATIRTAAGTSANPSWDSPHFAGYASDTVDSMWGGIWRGILLFDTSPLTSRAKISSAVMSIYGNAVGGTLSDVADINVYTSTPASNTNLVAADYAQIGSTAQCDTAIAAGSWNTGGYNEFWLNSTGRGNIDKTGITKFGTRDASHDVANVSPTWASDDYSVIDGYSADATGTANDPTLAVTYSGGYADNFNRADETPIGGDWDTLSGQEVNLSSNQVVPGGTSWNRYAWRSSEPYFDDHWSQLKLASSITTEVGGPAVRCQLNGDSFNGYIATIGDSSTLYVYAFYGSGGTAEQVGTTISGTFASGDVIKLAVVGQVLSVYQNGSLIGTRTDSNNRVTSGGTAGIMVHYDSAWDYWEGGDASNIRLVQNSAEIGNATDEFLEATFAAHVGVGNVVIVAANSESGVTLDSISDNLSHTWSSHLNASDQCRLWSTVVDTAGSMTVTVAMSWNGEYHPSIHISEWSGIDTADVYEAGAICTAGTLPVTTIAADGASSESPITPSNNGCLIFGFCYAIWGAGLSSGTGFQRIDLARAHSEYMLQQTAAQIDATWGATEADVSYYWLVAAFNPAITLIDFTHQGAIAGAKTYVSQRTIEILRVTTQVAQRYAASGRTIDIVRTAQLVEQRYINSVVMSEHVKVGTLYASKAWNSYVEFLAGLVLQQEGFRFRNDDGTEATATWKYAQDVNATGAANSTLRVRFVINATGDPGARNWQLEYRRSATDNWRKVN